MTPRGDELETGMDVGRMLGHADAYHYPWELEDDHAAELAEEISEQLARKRPPGFAPWPKD